MRIERRLLKSGLLSVQESGSFLNGIQKMVVNSCLRRSDEVTLRQGQAEIVRLKRNVESIFMSGKKDRVARVIWRSLGRHVEADHKLEVRRLPDGSDLEIHCCWCGNTVLAGSHQLVLHIVEALKKCGAKITNVARSVIEAA